MDGINLIGGAWLFDSSAYNSVLDFMQRSFSFSLFRRAAQTSCLLLMVWLANCSQPKIPLGLVRIDSSEPGITRVFLTDSVLGRKTLVSTADGDLNFEFDAAGRWSKLYKRYSDTSAIVIQRNWEGTDTTLVAILNNQKEKDGWMYFYNHNGDLLVQTKLVKGRNVSSWGFDFKNGKLTH